MLTFENDTAILEYCKIRLLGFDIELPEGMPATEEDMLRLRISAEEFLHRKAVNLTLLCQPYDPES
jgi:hypothetical protein